MVTMDKLLHCMEHVMVKVIVVKAMLMDYGWVASSGNGECPFFHFEPLPPKISVCGPERYILKILEKFGMSDCKSRSTTAETQL